MKIVAKKLRTPLAMAVAAAVAGWQPVVFAQEEDSGIPQPTVSGTPQPSEQIEEVVVTGRFISSSQQLVNERLNDAFATDLLGADTIARLGDSTVGDALRRVPGLSLVQDKFVYIRGLGERYSQTTLNGASIPSPDLTRNVIPLDIFPTSVVESLRVQKSWSPDLSANFGGGAVDIRTKGIPDAFTVKIDFDVGINSENPSNVTTYRGGGDDDLGTDDGWRALPQSISNGVARYEGQVNLVRIQQFESRADLSNPISFFEAGQINRQFATELNRDMLSLKDESVAPDYGLRASIGSRWDIGNEWTFGAAVSGSYDTDTRWRRTRTRDSGEETRDTQFGIREETTVNTSIAGTGNLGVTWTEDHEIETTHLFLRNTDDETEVFNFFNENLSFNPDSPSGQSSGFRDTRLEFEEREMTTNQIRGEHYWGDATREKFSFLDWGFVPTETKIDWFYSESEATTEIPSRVLFRDRTTVDNATLDVVDFQARLVRNAVEYRFTDLLDEVENYGASIMVPFNWGSNYVEFSGGYSHQHKARTYRTDQFSFGFTEVADPAILSLPAVDLYSDANITAAMRDPDITNPDPNAMVFTNSFEFATQDNRNSYIAAVATDGVWGKVDWTFNDTWRFAVGARWEDYRQVAI